MLDYKTIYGYTVLNSFIFKMQLIPFDRADLIVPTSTTQGGNSITARSKCGPLTFIVDVLIEGPATSSDYETAYLIIKIKRFEVPCGVI